MLFVDGENLTLRAQKIAFLNKIELIEGRHYIKDTFIWLPGHHPLTSMIPYQAVGLNPYAIRAHYYTSVVGDAQKVESTRTALWQSGFQSSVFKKEKQRNRSKGVDLSLAKDLLCNAFANNYDAAVLMAGDADYVPIVEEIKRMGKLVYVVFFHGAESGLSHNLQLASDKFFNLTADFISDWSPQQKLDTADISGNCVGESKKKVTTSTQTPNLPNNG